MGLPLRITFNNSDHVFQIANTSTVTKTTEEIQIVLEGKAITLVKSNSNGWVSKEVDESIDLGLIQAIGKAISLRYRI